MTKSHVGAGVTFGTRKQLQSEQGKAETEQMIAEHEEQKKQREACKKRVIPPNPLSRRF